MQSAINWYFEKQGVSQGPLSEDEMIDLLQRKQVGEATLVWHPGLEEWGSVQQLKPEWLNTVPAAAAKKPTFRKIEAQLPVDSTPPTLLPRPKAGIDPSEAPAKEKRGFLQRLFGLGKKK